MDGPDFPGALRAMADNIADHLGALTTRLRQRTEALSRVVAERDAYRKALVAVLELEPYEPDPADGPGGVPSFTRDEVHDAIGSDLIMRLMYRPRMILPPPMSPEQWKEAVEKAGLFVMPEGGVRWGEVRLPGEPDYKRVEKLMAEHGRSWEQAFRIALDEEELGQLGDPIDWRDATPKTLAGVAEAMTDLADRGWLPEGQAVDPSRDEPPKPDPCTCTIAFNKHDGSHIVDRESTCPVHGGAACQLCGSMNPSSRHCMICKDDCGGDASPCTDRWHEE